MTLPGKCVGLLCEYCPESDLDGWISNRSRCPEIENIQPHRRGTRTIELGADPCKN